MRKPHPNQLSIDFDAPRIPDRFTRVEAVRGSGKPLYHPESSNIESSRFGLKFSFRGGTYLVRGTYHTAVMSHLTDDQVYRVVDFAGVDHILTFRSGDYVPARVLKHDEIELTAAANAVIRDPYANPFLTIVHKRNLPA